MKRAGQSLAPSWPLRPESPVLRILMLSNVRVEDMFIGSWYFTHHANARPSLGLQCSIISNEVVTLLINYSFSFSRKTYVHDYMIL